MADIKITSTGETVFRIDGGVAKLLTRAFPTVFEQVGDSQPAGQPDPQKDLRGLSAQAGVPNDDPVPYFTEPKWVIATLLRSGRYALHLRIGASETWYDGAPENASKAFGREVPEALLQQYRAVYKPPDLG